MPSSSSRILGDLKAMASSPKRRAPFPPISLTNIPSEIVIDGILSRLPIRDAVRTSILSRSWRRRWRSIPPLTFDNLPIAVVDHVLSLHSGTIRSFSVSFLSEFDESTDYYVDRWIAALSNDPDPLKSLSLYFNDCYSLPHIPLNSTLFSFSNLTRLHLCGCALPTSMGFPVLETLNLTECIFPDGGNISALIFNCPLLQKLQLIRVERSCLHIWAPNLCSFVFEGAFKDFALVNAPLLTMTSISVFGSWDYSISVFRFWDSDEDDEEGGELDEYLANKCNLVKAFGGAKSIEKLDLLGCSLNFLGKFRVPKRVPDFFDRLKVLTLTVDLWVVKENLALLCLLRSAPNLQELDIRNPDYSEDDTTSRDEFWLQQDNLELSKLQVLKLTVDLQVVKENLALLCLLRSAPNLQELDIRKPYYWEADTTSGEEFWRQQDHLELSKLQVLKVDLITSPGTELEFINFILPAVPELKKMVVNIAVVVDIASGKHESILELKAKDLMEYWRASTRAEIVFPGSKSLGADGLTNWNRALNELKAEMGADISTGKVKPDETEPGATE